MNAEAGEACLHDPNRLPQGYMRPCDGTTPANPTNAPIALLLA